jgi:hypothetical protein
MARIPLLARNTKTLHAAKSAKGEQGTIDGRLARGFCGKKGMNGNVKRFGAGPVRRGVDLGFGFAKSLPAQLIVRCFSYGKSGLFEGSMK